MSLDGTQPALRAASFGLLPLQEEGGGSWIKIVIFLAVFIGPAILKSIQESSAKRKLARERALDNASAAPPRSAEVEQESEPEQEGVPDPLEQAIPGGREQWERLLRGEASAAPLAAPRKRALRSVDARAREVLRQTSSRTSWKAPR